MAIEKRVLNDHFEKSAQAKPALKQAGLRPQPKPEKPRKHFNAGCDDAKEKTYLSELEQVLLSISALHCLGFGKSHAQDERINRLLLSLLTGKIPQNSRISVEVQQVINRKSARTVAGLRIGRAFSCAEKHELRPLDEETPEEHTRRTASLAPAFRPPCPKPPRSLGLMQE
jgi:hypothetical protein